MLTSNTCFLAVALLAFIVNAIAETLTSSNLQVQADGSLSSSLLRREHLEITAGPTEELNSKVADVKASNEEVVVAETIAEPSSDTLEASRDDDVHSEAASVNLTTAQTEKSIRSVNHGGELEIEVASQANSTFYYTLVEQSKRCKKNTDGYKINVGNYQTEACFKYVLNEQSCGRYFHYGAADGVCDCLPPAVVCAREDASYYNVYWIQKAGPQAL